MTTKKDLRRQALRAAVKIREHLLGPIRCVQQAALPQDAWEELGRTLKRLRYAEPDAARRPGHDRRLAFEHSAILARLRVGRGGTQDDSGSFRGRFWPGTRSKP